LQWTNHCSHHFRLPLFRIASLGLESGKEAKRSSQFLTSVRKLESKDTKSIIMWTAWTEKATKGFTDAFEKTGEAITNVTAKAKGATSTESDTTETAPSVTTEAAAAAMEETTSSSSTTEQPSAVDTASVAETSGGTEHAALQSEQPTATTPKSKMGLGGFHLPSFHMNVNVPNPLKGVNVGVPNVAAAAVENKDKLFSNLQSGWTNVVQTTKRSIDATVTAVEKEQLRFEKSFGLRNSDMAGPHKRDPNLPLDVEALRDAEVVYITDRLITMSHPAMPSSVDPLISGDRKLAAIGHLLQRRHDGRFLVWNLSEVDYDISILDDQVMTFSFPGSPSPPLGLMLKLLVSMENWMKADERNVAVVHCLTGRGRTSTVLAAFLCWVGEAGFNDIHQSLAYIARCKQVSPDELTIPSQRRYASYFKNMLDGVRPSQPPLLLKRIIMSEAPKVSLFDWKKMEGGAE
jgi:hypothetical protein